MNETISCKEHLHTEHGAWCVCSSFLIKPEYLVQVGWKDLLMNNHYSWWKDSKVCCRSETTDTLIWKAAPRVTQFLQFNKPFIRHTKAPFVWNEEWIKTTSSEYTTCLTVIKHSALNRNINQRTPCKWIQIRTDTPDKKSLTLVHNVRSVEGKNLCKVALTWLPWIMVCLFLPW